jgi:cell division protein FtsI (penicillin-binding protein 3)
MSQDKNFLYYRAYAIYFGFVVLMLVVLYKTISLQMEGKSNVFSSSDDKIPYRTVERPARKGEILDRNYNTLLTHVTYYDIYMDPTVVSQKVFDKDLNELGQALHKMYPQDNEAYYVDLILKARNEGSRSVLIRKAVTNDQRLKLRKLPIFKLGRFKGGLIDDVEHVKIEKPYNPMLTRTLGDDRMIGIYGAYFNYLKGESGEEVEQRFATGWKKIGQVTKDAVEGADVVTTIDKEIQEVAHSELYRQVLALEADHGCVVVMEVKTGYVRAIANLKRKSNGTCADEFNYALAQGEVPGSTMKLASLMAGLEDGKFNITDKVNAVGTYNFAAGHKLKDSNHGNGYGQITIQQAFEKSSNVISQIIHNAYRNEPQRFLDKLKQFGVTEPLGIDLKGEANPVFPKPGTDAWNAISLPWMSIGYSVLQTPLQTLSLYNAIANNGKLVRPLFVQEIRRGGATIQTFNPVVLREKVCSDKTVKIMQECMKGVMTNGTGKQLISSMFKIAGKTGTAEIQGDKGQYGENESNSSYQASFVGYFPADNPIYSCIVVISKPNPAIAYYGAEAAGTVFAEVANKVYASSLKYHKAVNEGVKSKDLPQFKTGYSKDIISVAQKLGLPYAIQSLGDWQGADTTKGKVIISSKLKLDGKVPNVLGMNAKDAVYILESKGLIVKMKGFGKVVSQSLTPGTSLTRGQVIRLEFK